MYAQQTEVLEMVQLQTIGARLPIATCVSFSQLSARRKRSHESRQRRCDATVTFFVNVVRNKDRTVNRASGDGDMHHPDHPDISTYIGIYARKELVQGRKKMKTTKDIQ